MIRFATTDDAGGIASVHIASWQAAYQGLIPDEVLANLDYGTRKSMWFTSLQRNPRETLVAVDGEEIIGIANFGCYRDNKDALSTGEIRAIYLLEQYWRKGVGSALLKRAVEAMAASGYINLVLWVLNTNARAIAFYEKHYFALDGIEKTGIHAGVELNEIRMSRSLEYKNDA